MTESKLNVHQRLAEAIKASGAIAKTGKMEFGDPLDDEAEENDLLADCVLSWRGVVFNGEAVPCTRAAVMKLLCDKKRAWFRKAIKDAFDDQEAFTRVSASA